MKKAKQRPNNGRHKYLGWDGKLYSTPLTPGDPTIGELMRDIKHIARSKAWTNGRAIIWLP